MNTIIQTLIEKVILLVFVVENFLKKYVLISLSFTKQLKTVLQMVSANQHSV